MQIHTIAHYSWVVFVEDEQILTLCFVLVIPGLPAQGEVQHRMLTDLNNDAFPPFPTFASGLEYILSPWFQYWFYCSYNAIYFLLLPQILMKAPCKSITIIFVFILFFTRIPFFSSHSFRL